MLLYNCSCDQRVIGLPTELYFMISDNELERLCTEGNGCQISNPFFGSYVESQGIVLTPEQVEQRREQDYEEEDSEDLYRDLDIPTNHWEE